MISMYSTGSSHSIRNTMVMTCNHRGSSRCGSRTVVAMVSVLSYCGGELGGPQVKDGGDDHQDQRDDSHRCAQPEPEDLERGLIDIHRQGECGLGCGAAEQHVRQGEVVEVSQCRQQQAQQQLSADLWQRHVPDLLDPGRPVEVGGLVHLVWGCSAGRRWS